MPRGGRQPGAGRKKGSRDKLPRRRRFSPQTLERAGDHPAWLDGADREGRPSLWLAAIEKRGMDGDVESLKWLSAFYTSYRHGLPGKVAEPVRITVGDMIRAAAAAAVAARDEALEEASRPPSTPQPLIPAAAGVPEPFAPIAAARPEPNAGPAATSKHPAVRAARAAALMQWERDHAAALLAAGEVDHSIGSKTECAVESDAPADGCGGA